MTYLQVNVSLPKPAFVDAGGCATLVTTSSGGLDFDSLHVAVGSATLGPLELGSISIDYTGESDTWEGTLVLTLPLPKEVKPDRDDQVRQRRLRCGEGRHRVPDGDPGLPRRHRS